MASQLYLQKNDELKGYDIIKKEGVLDRNTGETSDLTLATVYDPDFIDIMLETLNIEDRRDEDYTIISDNEEVDDSPVG